MNAMSDEQIVLYVMRNRSDYYKILMVERTASTEQIKSAYKKMAFRCHPDKNKHAQAADAFKFVGSAHTTLSDETKRRIYDRAGTAGVQRHESAGGRGGGGGAGNPRYRHAGANAHRDFFEQFFFGGGGEGGFFPPQGRGQQRPGGHPNAHYAEMELNPSLLMLIPILMFFLLAFLLQSGLTDVNTYTSGATDQASGARTNKGGAASFSLTPSPEEGFVLKRVTTLYGLSVPYYTSRRWAELLELRRDILMATEVEVLRSQRDYLGNRCEAETFKHRTRGRKDAPEVCTEYNRYRRALG